MNCSLPGSSVQGILQARILEWVAHSLLQEISPTQGSNPGLLHCRQILNHLSHQESPKVVWVYIHFVVVQSCPTLCHPMDCCMPGFLVLRHLLELAQIHVHWVSDTIQPSWPLSSPSSPPLPSPPPYIFLSIYFRLLFLHIYICKLVCICTYRFLSITVYYKTLNIVRCAID